MSDLASAALSRVTGLISASAVAVGISFFFGGALLKFFAIALAAGGLFFTVTTKPIDEEAAPEHRKKQLLYGSVCLGLIILYVILI